MTKPKEKLFTIPESAGKSGRTIISIYQAIKKGSLLAQKDPKTNQLMIEEKELERYVIRGRELSHRRFQGKILYDKSKGEYTLDEVAEILNIDRVKLNHEVNSLTNELSYSIKGKRFRVFHIDDINNFKKLLKERAKSKKK